MTMAKITGATLAPIYERLNGAPSYHPLEADTFADWSVEAGDIVTITRDGKSYDSPVHNSTMTWRKGQKIAISSTGNEKRDSVAKLSQRKYNRGSSGIRNSQSMFQHIETSYNGMTAGLMLASSSAALYVNNRYTQMSSGLKLSESSAHLYTENKYSQMSSGLKLTESSAHLYTENKYSQMSSGLKLSESSAHLYTENKYSQMSSGLKLSESSAHLYTENKYSQMSSGLKLSESSAHLYTENKYSQMSSGLKLSESSAHLYTENKYTQMESGLKLTESSARLYVDSKYNQMKAGLDVTMSSATLYAANRTTRAYIMTRINADGEGEALIDASKVKISGTTTINNVFTVIANAVGVKVPLICDGNVDISSNKVLNLYTATFQGSNPVTLTALELAGVIKSASVSGDTLTLTPFLGDAITFKKAATTHSPTATLPASASSEPPSEQFDLLGTILVGEKINNWFTQTANCEGGSSKLYKLNVDATDAYNKGRDSVTHSPSIDSVWTSSSTPSGGTQLNSLKTQYENAKDDGDFFCIRVDCNGTKKTYYCEP